MSCEADITMTVLQDRQVAPPNLPPVKFYEPLGKLLEQGAACR